MSARFLLAAMFAFGACSGGDSTGNPDPDDDLVLAIFAGNAQSTIVATATTAAPSVKVTNDDGDPVANVGVTFAVTAGGGTITGASQSTNDDGIATVGSWTLGTTAGANTLSASVSGASPSSVTFTATGTAGTPANALKTSGDAITSAAGLAVTTRPTVRVTDAHGNGVAGIDVEFAVASGSGSVTGASQTTDASGAAVVGSWTLGTVAGANSLTATVIQPAAALRMHGDNVANAIANSTLTFNATGVPGPVATLTKLAGDGLQATVGALLGTPPSVRAADQFGNVVSGLGVLFAVASGGGAATGTNQTTSAGGIATVGSWTMGATPGANTMTATAGTVTVTFTATAGAAFNAAQFNGTYTGSWTNTTFGSTGPGTAVVVVNEANQTASVTINVGGSVLGTGAGHNSVQNGAYTSNGVAFTGNVPPMGTVTATLGPNGQVTASGTNPPDPSISGWIATGTLTAAALTLNFTVNFANGSTAVGTINLTKV